MKVLRKHVLILLLLIMIFRLPGTHAQAPFKNSTKISAVLNVNLPDSSSEIKDGFVTTYYGGDTLESYELNYFDTNVVKISSEFDLNLVLKSFVAGKFAGEGYKSYDLRLTDTLVGNLPGLFISGTTDDTLQETKKFYCFVTIANSNSYWFFYYLRSPSLPTTKADNFFSSIQFNRNKIKEAAFKIHSFKMHKAIGKTWYLSPELDYPMSTNERKKRTKDKPSYLPKPPPPPIRREWVVKASKLASDYILNQSLADKKYKKDGRLIIVEGIVKEIRETDDHGITIIILNGAPSKIDLQCEVLNSYKIKNLKKGMKAIFHAHCDGKNGNIILSQCLYIEKPTYE
jgi:tRNA_anti-like